MKAVHAVLRMVDGMVQAADARVHVASRGLHSFAPQLNLSRFGHTSPCPPV